jgi:hypothetical protein
MQWRQQRRRSIAGDSSVDVFDELLRQSSGELRRTAPALLYSVESADNVL